MGHEVASPQPASRERIAHRETSINLGDWFGPPLEPLRRSVTYRLCAMVIIVPTLLLPAVYVAIIALLAWALVAHAIYSPSYLLTTVRLYTVVLYILPLLIAPILIFFMLKPILARRVRPSSQFELERAQEPLLYEFVERIAHCINSPSPDRIAVSIVPNAGASLHGWMPGRRKLVLHLGMPLFESMNTRQLAGVIAHELGHFSQGFGMRASSAIRSVNDWFGRAVYMRDKWDERLQSLVGSDSIGYITIVAIISQFLVWVTRRILWVLLVTSSVIGCLLLRQMEYDADAQEVRIAGNREFAAAARRMVLLGACMDRAMSDLQRWRAEGRLPDNLAATCAGLVNHAPPSARQYVDNVCRDRSTPLLASHPPMQLRIERAERRVTDGIMTVERPSTDLLSNGHVLGMWTTLGCYKDYFGSRVTPSDLVPASKLIDRIQLEDRVYEAGANWFMQVYPYCVLPLPHVNGATDQEERALVQQLAAARRDHLAGLRESQRVRDELTRLLGRQSEIETIRAMKEAQISINARFNNLPSADPRTLRQCLARVETDIETAAGAVDNINTLAARRIALCVALLEHPKARRQLPNHDRLRQQIRRIVPFLQGVIDTRPLMIELDRALCVLQGLAEMADRYHTSEVYCDRLHQQVRSVNALRTRLINMLRDIDHPFPSRSTNSSVRRYVAEPVTGLDEINTAGAQAAMTMSRMLELSELACGRLALICERVERVFGAKPHRKPVSTDEPSPDQPRDRV